ncbi:2Fe-2S iron-sulfur cluster-binding protein [Colwellia sp. MSW7]|uniref:2Fe-2S iron-sulfur cluster-binding protein n=1 Tax=Colwellia maritima TaxID=2912588 RepID=A0ABS9X654_9GAMM|nr:2Fe-2S iron-sulfur cluster-binding protein [Colwellia maritima]
MLQYFDPKKESNPNKDYGTPSAGVNFATDNSAELINITIDGQNIAVPEGTSIMRAAALADINIPKLCATDSIEAFGSCRVCLVEIEGRRGFPASCTTPVEEGLVVKTQNQKIAKIRRNVVELYISDHPLDCLTCAANGDCELQDVTGQVGLRDVRYGFEGKNHLTAEKDTGIHILLLSPVNALFARVAYELVKKYRALSRLQLRGVVLILR